MTTSCESCGTLRSGIDKAMTYLIDALADADMSADAGGRVGSTGDHTAMGGAIGEAVAPIDIIMSGLLELKPKGVPVTPAAIAMMYAIGQQESRFTHRFQIPLANAANRKGPARGLWQFEVMGGVAGVLQHHTTRARAEELAKAHVGSLAPYAVWATLEYDDTLAAAFARLLLWSDPAPLPEPTAENEDVAWEYYMKNWRPGKPHRPTWGRFWQEAIDLIK